MRINRQIIMIVSISMGLLLIFTIVFSYHSMNSLKNREVDQVRQILLKERKNQLRDAVQNAYSVLETANFYEPAQAAISSMRFGEDNQNYFFVIDQKGMFWVHPDQPGLVGNVYQDLADINGKRYIEQIIKATQEVGDSFVKYQIYHTGSTRPSTKLVHFKKFQEWGWIVCAGIFIDDIDAVVRQKETQIQSAMIRQIKVFAFAGLLALIFSLIVSLRFLQAKLVKPMEELTMVAEDMIVGNFEREINIRSNYEINRLASAMQRMQDSFLIAFERLKRRPNPSKPIVLLKGEPNVKDPCERAKEKEYPAFRSAS